MVPWAAGTDAEMGSGLGPPQRLGRDAEELQAGGALIYADKTDRKEVPSLTTETRSNTEKGALIYANRRGLGLGRGGWGGKGFVSPTRAHLFPRIPPIPRFPLSSRLIRAVRG